MSKYYKSINSPLVIKATAILQSGDFEGKVIVATEHHKLFKIKFWIGSQFEPYTPTPQELAEWGETETVTNDNPKDIAIQPTDVEIRLRCLEMACERLMDTIFASEDIVIEAQEFYDWITKKD